MLSNGNRDLNMGKHICMCRHLTNYFCLVGFLFIYKKRYETHERKDYNTTGCPRHKIKMKKKKEKKFFFLTLSEINLMNNDNRH